MDSIHNHAEEIVLNELIYKKIYNPCYLVSLITWVAFIWLINNTLQAYAIKE